MEGYLQVFPKGYKSKPKNVWAVLDGQQLTYYDGLDMKEQKPMKVLAVLFMKGATVEKTTIKDIIRHGLTLKTGKITTLFDCGDARVCTTWFEPLRKSTRLHIDLEELRTKPARYRAILGFSATETLSKHQIARVYKKQCLKQHPDKGGDVNTFNKLKEAYDVLLSYQQIEDENNSTVPIQYEATIQKGGMGIGLGLKITEVSARQQVLIGEVMDNIILQGITEEADGAILPGDRIIGIDQDECSNWAGSRVRARLSNVRVPIGSSVLFTFERRIPKELLSGEDTSDISPLPTPFKTSHKQCDTKTEENTGQGSFTFPPSPPPSPSPPTQGQVKDKSVSNINNSHITEGANFVAETETDPALSQNPVPIVIPSVDSATEFTPVKSQETAAPALHRVFLDLNAEDVCSEQSNEVHSNHNQATDAQVYPLPPGQMGTETDTFVFNVQGEHPDSGNSHAPVCDTDNTMDEIQILREFLQPALDKKLLEMQYEVSDANKSLIAQAACIDKLSSEKAALQDTIGHVTQAIEEQSLHNASDSGSLHTAELIMQIEEGKRENCALWNQLNSCRYTLNVQACGSTLAVRNVTGVDNEQNQPVTNVSSVRNRADMPGSIAEADRRQRALYLQREQRAANIERMLHNALSYAVSPTSASSCQSR